MKAQPALSSASLARVYAWAEKNDGVHELATAYLSMCSGIGAELKFILNEQMTIRDRLGRLCLEFMKEIES